jgi:hypothetical protein
VRFDYEDVITKSRRVWDQSGIVFVVDSIDIYYIISKMMNYITNNFFLNSNRAYEYIIN